jgi:hypothetical protein
MICWIHAEGCRVAKKGRHRWHDSQAVYADYSNYPMLGLGYMEAIPGIYSANELPDVSARADDRRVINGIFYILRTGARWRDRRERYGPSTTTYNRFTRWARRGIRKRVFDALAA